ncbi:hypothetical protein [Kineococcus sp. SYSU DK006]|uniref:hypothetical protein n=1 Tax=Kineococcus sp. SYSU DK006 TaxID=3383127 RepID=UPI003D7E9F45
MLEWFQHWVLTSLLLTQVFLFAASQFAATAGLLVDLALLGVVSAGLAARRLRPGVSSPAGGPPPGSCGR